MDDITYFGLWILYRVTHCCPWLGCSYPIWRVHDCNAERYMVWIYWIRDCDGSWLLCSDKEQEERRRGLIITGCCFVFSHDCLLGIHDCQCIDMVNVIQQVFFNNYWLQGTWKGTAVDKGWECYKWYFSGSVRSRESLSVGATKEPCLWHAFGSILPVFSFSSSCCSLEDYISHLWRTPCFGLIKEDFIM